MPTKETPKQEMLLLNWEIANLTIKLQAFSKSFSTVDLKTVDFMDKLLTTMHGFLTNKSLVPVSDWDEDDRAIFDGYVFARSINCVTCDRSIKIAKPSLVKHLGEHGYKTFHQPKKETVVHNKKFLPMKYDKPCLTEKGLPVASNFVSKNMQKFLSVPPTTYLERVAFSQPRDNVRPVHEIIADELKDFLKERSPDVAIYPFGSRLTGLNSDSSDLDVYIDLNGNINGETQYSKDQIEGFFNRVEGALADSGEWSKFKQIIAARTPILIAWSQKHKIQCDISFTNGLSLKNTELVKYFFELQPVCFKVARYVKAWVRHLNIDALNGYTVTLLVVFFFQKHNLLPSVFSLQRYVSAEGIHRIAQWRVDFERKSLEELKMSQVPETETGSTVVQFFKYYGGEFKFGTDIVCPFLGEPQPKKNFDHREGKIPTQMKLLREYYAQLDKDEAHPINHLLSYSKPLVVQDPFELNHNVAKGLSADNVSRFRAMCGQAKKLLSSSLSNGAES